MRALLEKIKHNVIMQRVCEFQRTPLFIALVAAIAFLSHTFGLEIFAFWTIAAIGVFTLVFQEDTTPFLPCAFLALFSISRQNGATSSVQSGILLKPYFIVNGIIIVCLVLAALVFHVVYYRQYRNFKKLTFLTSGLAALSLGFLTNGLFSSGYNWLNLPLGLMFSALYFGVYLFVFHTVKWKKNFSMRYLAFIFFIMGLLIVAEMGVLYIRLPELRATGDKDLVWLGWGLSNAIGFLFMLTIPFGFYLTHTEKISLPYYLGTSLMLIAVVATFSRGSLVIALPLFVAGSIFVCLFARSKKQLWVMAAILLAGAIVVVVVYREWLLQKLNFYIETGFKDRGRFELWLHCLESFLRAPVFGRGLMFEFAEYFKTFFWAHNTPLQFLTTGGIVGLGTYLFHRVQTGILFFKKPTTDRLFAGLAVLCLLVNSLLDVAMSCQHVVIFYAVILAFSEKDLLFKTGKIDANGECVAAVNAEETGTAKIEHEVEKSAPAAVESREQAPQPIAKTTLATTVSAPTVDSLIDAVKTAEADSVGLKSKEKQKVRVLFPAVEAGLGHMVPMNSVAEIFEKKYGDVTDVIRIDFFRDDATEPMRKLERLFVKTVGKQNKIRGYGSLSFVLMDLFSSDSLKAVMQWFVKDSYADGLHKMTRLDADIVFSTHWATSYYAARIDKKPINVQYCPDARMDVLWDTGADCTLIPAQVAIDKARRKKRFDGMHLVISQFIIRNEAFKIERNRAVLRKQLGLKDCPTITLADGGYGAGKLGKTVRQLLKSDRELNVVAICGKNVKLHEQLKTANVPENINFVNLAFTNDMLKYIAVADVFVGKSGASSMAEPRYFGVPIIVTMFATPIERDNAKYYIEEVGCAVKEFNVKKAVAKAFELLDDKEQYERLRNAALKESESNGAEKIADYLFSLLNEKFGKDEHGNLIRER